MEKYVCFNGNILLSSEVKVSPLNRGMMYGDGCFETLKSYQGRFIDFEAHYQRLCVAFEYLNMDASLTQAGLFENISSLLKANNIQDKQAIIRFQCWRKGGRGYKTDRRECDWIITSIVTKDVQHAPIRLIIAKTPVIPSFVLNRAVKLSNGLNYILAAQEAEMQQVDDAIMLTVDGFISETTISNIFWGSANTIYTPSQNCDLLPGVTRKLILEILSETEFEVTIDKFTIHELKSAEFVFTTNSVSEIRAVESIDNYHLDAKHPEIQRIKSMYEALKNDRLS